MSERTTIGGTVYEAIGSSSSNLLLRCNGTARIQWGGKLIDLIKNGKIASSDSKELIFTISNESEIKSDGVYILTTEESSKLLVCKDGNTYDFTDANIYISASKEQNLTVDQKKQALENIGIQYNTLTELQSAGIKNGLAYVCDTATLYTVKNGDIKEFEAKLKTVTVEKEETGEGMNSSEKIVLSILDDEYLILADQRITANYSIHVKDSAQIGSESADKTKGYRLYIDGGTSYLDVDKINVRKGLGSTQYQEITFEDLRTLMSTKKLVPHEWYLITDFQNHWKLVIENNKFNRPILVRALNEQSLYKKGYLFKDHRIEIQYDPDYQESIKQQKVDGTEQVIDTRGRITWMKDQYNNEANFDFLDYTSASEEELTILHYPSGDETQDKSIFPKNSYNNKLVIYDLKGTVLKEQVLVNDNVNTINFEFDDSKELTMEMHDNVIECRSLVVKSGCNKFTHNTLKQVIKLEISSEFTHNDIGLLYSRTDYADIETTPFDEILDNNVFNTVTFNNKTSYFISKVIKHSTFNQEIKNTTLESVIKTTINASLNNVTLKNLQECIIDEGSIEFVSSYYDFNTITFNQTDYPALYVPEKRKELHISTIDGTSTIKTIVIPEAIFYRGMIIMHSGIEPVPNGWAPCDGKEYEWNGVKSKTPDLSNRFIKAVTTVEEIKATDNKNLNENGEIVLTTDNLPVHSHPHKSHIHTFSDSGTAYDTIGALTSSEEGTVITAVEGGTEGKAITKTTYTSSIEVYDSNVAVSGDTSEVTSEESGWLYKKEPDPINTMPNYYSLIFIMKL